MEAQAITVCPRFCLSSSSQICEYDCFASVLLKYQVPRWKYGFSGYCLHSWLSDLEVCHRQGGIVLVLMWNCFQACIYHTYSVVCVLKIKRICKKISWKYATWIRSEFKSRLILSSKFCSLAFVDSVGFNYYLTKLNVLISSCRLARGMRSARYLSC